MFCHSTVQTCVD